MQHAKVFLLMASLTAFAASVGGALGGQGGAVLAFGIAVATNVGMYWRSDRLVLRMYRAEIVDEARAPGLHRMVDRLRRRADLPMPAVALAPSAQPNAFATGRSPARAVVCFTEGLLEALTREELEGVTAHELAHVKHRHMLTGTIAATMAGAVGILSSMVRWATVFGGGRDDDNHPATMLVMALVAPLGAMVVQMAISRQNEFQADRTGGRIVGNPLHLASALRTLERGAQRTPMQVNPAAAQLAIVDPFGARQPALLKLFRTHPPTEERVARLSAQVRESR